MAKKKEDSNDSAVLWTIGAFLVGSALTQPTKDSINQFNFHRSQDQLFDQYKLHYNEFLSYLTDKNLIQDFKKEKRLKESRLSSLGNIGINPKIANYPNIRQFLDEAIQLFLNGYFRNSCISCAIVMESLLKLKFPNLKFVDLIKEANQQGLISKSDKSHLDGIRLDRNDFVHSLNHNANENDAKIIILITSRILNKVL